MSTTAVAPMGRRDSEFLPLAEASEAATQHQAALMDLSISAGYRNVATLQNVALQVHPGERLGVVGSSGAGKSTLAMAAMGLLPWRGGWATGRMMFEGRNLLALREREWRHLRGKKIALVPQSPGTALNPCLSLRKHFEEAWRAHAAPSPQLLEERMHVLLQRVDLPIEKHFLHRKPKEISIGQAQRVLIALALLHGPRLLIADEPTSALDACNQAETLRLLNDLTREYRMGLLFISHDLVSVVQMCERMLVLDKGVAVETLRCDELGAGTRFHPATQRLLQTLPAPPEVLRRHLA
ncbi:MAG: ATP-binding cassette domain-containing protein [Janthinobacterium lividum]